MFLIRYIGNALGMAFAIFWEIFWALALGFFISGIVQAVVSNKEMSKLLPDDRPPTIWKALGLGAASSSCSYAAVAITRSAFRKVGLYRSDGFRDGFDQYGRRAGHHPRHPHRLAVRRR